MKLAYLDCFSGVSGDMLVGALLDAGLPLAELRAGLAALPLTGFELAAEPVTDHGIHGMRAVVRLDDAAPHEHRGIADIETLLASSALPPRVRARALAIFRRLAAAEARIHGTTPDEVIFHEVGAVDAIVDITGAALGLELLGVEELYCSELPLTSGRVRSAHGPLPVPAPATLELLRETGARWRSVPAEGELVTPTGAAIIATLARFERPSVAVRAIGYGFGQRTTLPWANCLRLLLGEVPSAADEAAGFERDEVIVLESNIDNMSGEALGWLMERLLAATNEEEPPRRAADGAGAAGRCASARGTHPHGQRNARRAHACGRAAEGGAARRRNRDATRQRARQAQAHRWPRRLGHTRI